MSSYDHPIKLTEQYVQLTRTVPRKLVQAPAANSPGTVAVHLSEPPEAEWSLRRIEGRVGSIA